MTTVPKIEKTSEKPSQEVTALDVREKVDERFGKNTEEALKKGAEVTLKLVDFSSVAERRTAEIQKEKLSEEEKKILVAGQESLINFSQQMV